MAGIGRQSPSPIVADNYSTVGSRPQPGAKAGFEYEEQLRLIVNSEPVPFAAGPGNSGWALR